MKASSNLPLPASLLRRLRFRARARHQSLEAELIRCLNRGLEVDQGCERFRDRARRLREHSRGVLRSDSLEELVAQGRV